MLKLHYLEHFDKLYGLNKSPEHRVMLTKLDNNMSRDYYITITQTQVVLKLHYLEHCDKLYGLNKSPEHQVVLTKLDNNMSREYYISITQTLKTSGNIFCTLRNYLNLQITRM